jgi:hypothetical protein
MAKAKRTAKKKAAKQNIHVHLFGHHPKGTHVIIEHQARHTAKPKAKRRRRKRSS